MKIFGKVLIVANLFAVAESQCSVCGDGNEVTNPEAVFSFPGQPDTSCGDLEEDGELGLLPPQQCDILPTLIEDLCGCAQIPCNICGEGKEVGNPDPTFSFPGQPPLSCGELEDEGEQGLVDEDLCGILPNLVESLCECQPIGSTNAPTFPTVDLCSVCGDEKKVNNPGAIFSFPSQPSRTCEELEDEGEQGLLPGDECAFLPDLIEDLCDCQPIQEPGESCAVCGEGQIVGDPGEIFSFPGQPTRSCGELEDEGEQGLLDEDFCDTLPDLIDTLCACQSEGSTIAPTPTASQGEGCSICGEGKEVNDPDAIFAFPSQPERTCGALEDEGEQGLLPEDQCSILPTLIEDLCNCQPIQEPGDSCNICGEGNEVGNPDAIFAFPSQPEKTCGELEDEGEQGLVSQEQCDILPALVDDLCECKPKGSTDAPTSTPPPGEGCSVCGEGSKVNNPDAVFAFPSQPPKTCGELEDEGEQGLLPEDECNILPTLIEDLCDCQPMQEPGDSCSVCGEGKMVTNPDAIFAFPSQPEKSCGELEDEGEQGLLPEDECVILPVLVDELCGCQPVSPSEPTGAPVFILPTIAPEEQSSEAPTVATDAPVVEPTDAPVQPTGTPIQPTNAPVFPTNAPVQPTEAPIQPTDAPVSPTEAPIQPTDAPILPTNAPNQPTDAPVQPSDAPIDPTEAPIQATDAPVPPTDTPIQPSDAPVQPTEAPVPPTDAPVQPTEAPVDPTNAPVVPTPNPTVAPTLVPVRPTLAPVDPTNFPTIHRTRFPTVLPSIFGKKGDAGEMGKKGADKMPKDQKKGDDGERGKKGADKMPRYQKHKGNT